MTDERHTPGPWRTVVDGTGSGRWIAVVADDWEFDDGSPHELFRSETIQTSTTDSIEDGWEDVEDADTIRANARLIADAPRLASTVSLLVEALERSITTLERARRFLSHGTSSLRQFCNGADDCAAHQVEDAIEEAREVLARARGEGQ